MPKQPRNWRAALTTGEQAELEPIETELAALRERLSWLSWKYHRIQNRASVRAGATLTIPAKPKVLPSVSDGCKPAGAWPRTAKPKRKK